MKMQLPLRYEPSGDCDGEMYGTDHIVVDSNNEEIAIAPDEKSALLLVKSANCHHRLLAAAIASLGAYEALRIVGADKGLPGFDSCLKELNEIIEEAQGKTMSCPTCDHTMFYVGGEAQKFHLCPRCGTLKVQVCQGDPMFYVPQLVRRCQEFDNYFMCQIEGGANANDVWQDWKRRGLEEAIHKPEDRT